MDRVDPETDLCSLGVLDLASGYRAGSLSPVDVVNATLARIVQVNPVINAYLAVAADDARAAARTAAAELAAGVDRGPLHGVPVAVKDNIDVAGMRTSGASRLLDHAPPARTDAPVVRQLREAGAVLLGKTNLSEMAAAESDPASPFPTIRNPRNVAHQAGISSGGSAAAVAAGLCALALGTDTGGSVRHPASVCGVVGLKPARGVLSMEGVLPVSRVLDHVGLIARSVSDTRSGLLALAGSPAPGLTSVESPTAYRGLTVGYPTDRYYDFGRRTSLRLYAAAREALQTRGVDMTPVVLNGSDEINDIVDVLALPEIALHIETYPEFQSLCGRPLLKRVQRGRRTSAKQYLAAVFRASQLEQAWTALLEAVDAILLPANTAGAPRIGQRQIWVGGHSYHPSSVNSRFNRAANLFGLPSMTLPIGQTSRGLPISVQLVSATGAEDRLFRIGLLLEEAFGSAAATWGIDIH